MLHETADGLYCPAGDFYIDPWGTVERAVITHAHGDHARAGSHAYLCAAPCEALLERRLDPVPSSRLCPTTTRCRVGSVTISFHPAGHILGSAQVRVEGEGGVWVVSGDYKREADPTCEPFDSALVGAWYACSGVSCRRPAARSICGRAGKSL